MNGLLITTNSQKKSETITLEEYKKELIEKINEINDIEEIERFISYYPIIKEDQDWDYGFLLDLIEFKLKRMREYFWTHNIAENEKQYGNICNTLINILNAGYKTDIILAKDLQTHVNTRNVHRFFSPKTLEFILKENLLKYYLPTVRQQKAIALFWKYLEWHIEELWD